MKKEASGNSNLGIVGVVFGILSIISLSAAGVLMGAVGLGFSIAQNKRERNGWGKAGMILNIIGIILGIVATIFLVKFFGDYVSQFQQLQA